MPVIIRTRSVLTGNHQGDILSDHAIVVDGNRISRIVPDSDIRNADPGASVDARHCIAIPGFIQTHVHLCQTLFRGLADDLELLDWLQKRIFPLEAAHTACSMHASSQIGIAELIRSGTTTILDMGSINHEEEIIRAIAESGMRAFVGKAMMDANTLYPALREDTRESIRSTRDLAERWHGSYEDRIRYAVAPRFVLSCTDGLMKEAHEIMRSLPGALFHTHASENVHELEEVRKRCNLDNIEFLHHLGLLSERACLAHCIHVSPAEIGILESTKANVAHCPSSNLKLASGIANIPGFIDRGVNVSIGADGAPCNNSLDMFHEMRLAAVVQKPRHGPRAMSARTVFGMATRGGARSLGLEDQIGSLEPGKKADLVLLDLNRVWNPLREDEDPFASIVYTAGPENVDSVMIDGKWVLRNRELTTIDEERILAGARGELKQLLSRTHGF